jgi:hypothetical protein
MKLSSTFTIALITFLLFPLVGSSQCRSYTKKKCRPALAPYQHNGQLNNAVLVPGDKAEIMLTFYSGQEYRVSVCYMPILGDVAFKVKDTDKNLIFDSTKNENDYFDFKVAATQQLVVEIKVPDSEKANEIVPQGCVSVLVGFKGDS